MNFTISSIWFAFSSGKEDFETPTSSQVQNETTGEEQPINTTTEISEQPINTTIELSQTGKLTLFPYRVIDY